MGPGAVRALKVAVVVMGVVIVLGTGLLVALIVQRVMHAHGAGGNAAAGGAAGGVPIVAAAAPVVAGNAVLDEPAGTHIAAVSAYGGGLAVTLSGGGPDRVVLLDGALRVVGRISLAR